MVWLFESPGGSAFACKRREMEGLFPCSKRVVSTLENVGIHRRKVSKIDGLAINRMAFAPANHQSSAHGVTARRYTPALVALAVLYFMMGFITCLNDTLVPFFKEGFTLGYAESSLVQFYFFRSEEHTSELQSREN